MLTSFPFSILLVVVLASVSFCQAQTGFVETFSRTGPYSSSNVVLEGFDNPGWRYVGDGMFRDGGLWVENPRNAAADNNNDGLARDEIWKRGFDSTIEIREHTLAVDEGEDGFAQIGFAHHFERGSLGFAIVADNSGPVGTYGVRLTSGDQREREFLTVDQGPHILMSISFEEDTSQVTYRYDNNLDDAIAPVTIATLDFSGTIIGQAAVTLGVGKEDAGHADAFIDHWAFVPFSFPGDFNANGIFDAEDVNLLNAEIRRETNDPDFDLVEDGIVDAFDRNFWVHTLNETYFGDANLDGEFNSADLVNVFQAGHYEDGIEFNSGWAEGDWNGNGDFESGDLIVAFQDGGYELGPRAAVAVPEPCGSLMFQVGIIGLWVISSTRLGRRPIPEG